MRKLALALALAAALTAIAGCGGDDGATPSSNPTTTAAPDGTGAAPRGGRDGGPGRQATRPALTIVTGPSAFGEILFDGDRRAIYIFDAEESARPECYGECAAAWPPALVEGELRASSGADAGMLGTTRRTDGTRQATYDGRPLYYYVDDPPGEVLCHGVEEFGGLWLVVGPDGAPLS